MHRGCFVWTPTPPLSGRRTPRPGPARVCVCMPCLAGSGGPASRARFGAPHLSFGRSWFALCLFRPSPGWGCPVCGCCWVFLFLFFLFGFFSPSPPYCAPVLCCLACFPAPGALGRGVLSPPPPFFCFFPSPPFVRPVVSCFACFPAWGALGLGVLPPPFFFPFCPPPPPFLLSPAFFCFPVALGLCAPPPLLFFSLCGAVLRSAGARSLCCARRLCCFWWLVLLVPGVAAFCWGSAGGSGCPALSFGGVCRLPCPCLVWPPLGVFPMVSCSPVLCPVALCCRVVLYCGALSYFFFFLFFSPLVALVSCCSRWFWAPGRFRVVSVSVLCLGGAVLVCLCRCSLFGALVPSRGWLLFCVVACCVCVFAAGPGCPLLSPGGSSWLLVSCLGGVLWCVPGCCAAPCCCALCRLALRCCALCCFVLLSLVLPRAVSCLGALSVVLGSCAFWCRVLSCPPAPCVFCCGVSPRGVVRRCALCRVRPGVSCCAFPVVSALCGVAVWPALPWCPAPLCCAPWCCVAAWCRGVLSCRLVGFVSCVGVVVPT